MSTYSLMMCGCLNSLRFCISRRILPTTSKLLILFRLRILIATLWPVSSCWPSAMKDRKYPLPICRVQHLNMIISTHTHTHTHIYIYIHTGVCVCVCVYVSWLPRLNLCLNWIKPLLYTTAIFTIFFNPTAIQKQNKKHYKSIIKWLQ